jgi:putative ABC transport system permease protein
MFRWLDLLAFTVERMRQHRLLILWVTVGLTMAVTLTLSLSLYVDAVYSELLESRLENPPYAIRYRYLGAWNGNISQADVEAIHANVENVFVPTVNLPIKKSVHYVRGGTWSPRVNEAFSMGNVGIGAVTGMDSLLAISSGTWSPDSQTDDEIIPVLASETLLYNRGLQVGDRLTLPNQERPLEIVALWHPQNSNDPEWIFPPRFFDEVLLIPERDLWELVQNNPKPVDEAAWFMIFDGSEVRPSDIGNLIGKLGEGQRQIVRALNGIRLDLTPEEELRAFQNEVNTLQAQLFIIIAPVGGMVLYFVALVAGLLVTRQQAEDVKLRSRGMGRMKLLILHSLMWGLMVMFSVGVSLFLAPYVVRLVGQTTSFLKFDAPPSQLNIEITALSLWISIATGFLSASSGLILAWRTTGQNINSYRQSNTDQRPAWWQRMYLDVLLLIPAVYLLWTMNQDGGIATQIDTPFSNPLTFVAPTLFSLSLTLLFLRILPIVLKLGASVLSVTRNIAFLMALRELTRSAGRYRGALLMMAFTLSLTGFTASMASTLDASLVDTINYRIGADVVLEIALDPQTEQETDEATGRVTSTVTGYNAPPLEELLDVEGIFQASRFGNYPARISIGNQRADGRIIGIDRSALASVTRWRADFSTLSLAENLNLLAPQRTGVLINRATLERYNLRLYEEVTLEVNALNTWYRTTVPIMGVVDYFPTLDPTDGFFMIGGLDMIFELVGTNLPYNIWVGLQQNADPAQVIQDIRALRYPVARFHEPSQALADAQAEPARRGVLGFLSVGFIASISLTLIVAIVQSTASFKAQSAQLGALRAMGLGGLTVAVYVITLQGIATLSGILSGTGIGLLTTWLFLPLLDFSAGMPPYEVRVAWDEIMLVYGTFAGILFLLTFLMTVILSREQLTTIVRLGEG